MADSKQSRVLVNVLGIPSLIVLVIVGGPVFAGFVTVVMLLGVRELRILTTKDKSDPLLILLAVSLILLTCMYYYSINFITELIIILTVLTSVIEIFRSKKTPFHNIAVILFGFIWLGLMFGSMIRLRNYEAGGYNIGFELTFAMMLSVWICDSAAFIFGKKFGWKKILPAVSPQKSWVGSIAGIIAAFIVMTILYFTDFAVVGYPSADGFFNGWLDITDVFVLAVIFGVFGQLGDFTESLLKREAGVKDSSSFLRGHGGILDRFDSLTFTTPILVIYTKYFIN